MSSAFSFTTSMSDDPPGISQVAPTTPPGLQRLLDRCLEKSPEQRFHSASDLAFALEALSDSGNSAVVANTKDSGSRWVWVGAGGAVIVFAALLIAWWRMPPAVPVVESVTALTDDGEPKVTIFSDDSQIYFNEVRPGNWRIAQVSVTGGATARVETRFANPFIVGLKPDGSALLAAVLNNTAARAVAPLWLIPLPAGEPRRLGNFEAGNADMFPDGRIVFAKLTQGTDAKGADSRTDWFVAEKDGSDPRKLVSLPGQIGPVWVAPDGQRILIEEDHDGARRILDIAADGTGVREIRKESPDECCFSWTPDKKYLLLIRECPAVRHLGSSYENENVPPSWKSHPIDKRTSALLRRTREPRRKADFCSRYEATWRTGSLRHEVASVPAVSLWNFSNRPDILPGWKVGRLHFLSGPGSVA
jgi:hypothetical protein